MAIAQAHYLNDITPRRAGLELALVLALHIGVAAALVSFEVLPLPAPLSTLMVRVIQTPPKQPEITPPRPKPVTSKPVPQYRLEPASERPLLVAEAPAPAAIERRTAIEAPVAKEIPAPLAASAAKATPTPLPLPAAAPPVIAVSEPRFDAAYLDNPAPVYPAQSRRIREEGQVILRVFVEADGRASQVEIKTSSRSPRLDQAAQDAVSRWKFFPAQRGAEAIGAWVLVPIVFNLRG